MLASKTKTIRNDRYYLQLFQFNTNRDFVNIDKKPNWLYSLIMTASQTGRYSKYIRPISISIDLSVILILGFLFFKDLNLRMEYFSIYQIVGWCTIAFFIRFYGIYRFTTPLEILSKLVKQGVLFLLITIAFFPFSKQVVFSGMVIAMFISSAMVLITISKFLLFYYLKEYRILTGSNYRSAIIIGYTPEAIELKNLFETRNDYGYRFLGYFSDKKSNQNIKGKLADLKPFVIENCVDEIYCSLNEISNEHLKDLIEFADENNKTIKFIPDTKEIFSKNLKIDYYEFFPVLSLKKTMLHEPATMIFKRVFDIVFSSIIIVVLLSWLIPLLAILIKLESRGPVFSNKEDPELMKMNFSVINFVP